MSGFAQWHRTSVAFVLLALGCRSKDRVAADTAGSAVADSAPLGAMQSDSVVAASSGNRVTLDTTPMAPLPTTPATAAKAGAAPTTAPVADLGAAKALTKESERVKDGAVAVGDLLVLERGSCRGGCTPYTMRLREDGRVTFTLLDGSKKKSTDTIAPAAVRALLESMRTGGFASLDTAYMQGTPGCGAYAADAPVVVLATIRTGKAHTVRHDYGCSDAPRSLRQWGAAADSIARTSRWLPSTSGKTK